MACTKEEIERKRLAALQKRQNKLSIGRYSDQNTSTSVQSRSPLPSSSNGGVKTLLGNSNRSHPYVKLSNSSDKSNVPVEKVVSGTIYLISEDRFEVNPSEFCTPLINIFKSLPSKSYG